MSAALWRRAGETPAGAFDDRADYQRNSVFERIGGLARLRVRIDCGTSDPFIAANRFPAQRLTRATARFTSGGHDELLACTGAGRDGVGGRDDVTPGSMYLRAPEGAAIHRTGGRCGDVTPQESRVSTL
ncbi:hypothetical protein [Intrasporangium oryzae]|uniref:hypothetical protein n=1 Tax=Intrasporangium oryzae TaxID=412687 RepID=UPI0012F84637|nr:hypothetical protein [Intrasporangium oryzae]